MGNGGRVAGREHPFFSVVLPVYNGRRFLGEALASISAQTEASWEAVIVDDGSSDDSIRITDQWADRQERRVAVVRAGADVGNVAAARNRGIAAARGRWVAFLDQDDWWQPEKLASQRQYIERHDGVRVVGCWPEVVFERGTHEAFVAQWSAIIRSISEKESGLLPLHHFVVGCLLCMSGVVARRADLLAHGGFSPSMQWTSDWLMWARMATSAPIGIVRAPLVNYRLHGQNELFRLLREGPNGAQALAQVHERLAQWLVSEGRVSADEASSTLTQLYWRAAPMWADAARAAAPGAG